MTNEYQQDRGRAEGVARLSVLIVVLALTVVFALVFESPRVLTHPHIEQRLAQPTKVSTQPPTSVSTTSSTPTTTLPVPSTTVPPFHPAAARAVTPTVSSPNIGVSGGHLVFDGKPYRFVGVNAYEIGTEWGTNAGCGDMESQAQLNTLFSSLAPNSLVRFWAYQETIAMNVHTGQLDWGPLDRVFDTAAAFHQRLIVVLTGQGSGCDGGHWQDPVWYNGGFKQVFNDATNSDGKGLMPLSYWQYVQDIVSRYKDSPALGMWEPISEPEASTCPAQYQPTNCSGHQTCPDETAAAQAMRHFFDVVGGEIHTLDPNHLVEDGMLGGGQCGTSGSDYAYVSASPGIDVLSYHDYYAGDVAMGGDQWNGLSVRFAQAASLGKPIIGGELGITAGTSSGCPTLATRASEVQGKIQAQFQAGTSGVLVWDWLPAVTSGCAFDAVPGDPLMQLVQQGPPA